MNSRLKSFILDILKTHRILTLATIRPDGWPQATTVGYGHDGLILYFVCGADSQKARNIAACNKVSLTVDQDTDEILAIRGLSMAAHAEFVTDEAAYPAIYARIMEKYPRYKDFPMPEAKTVKFVRLKPKLISVLDYAKGFGHTELVEVTAKDLKGS